VKEQSLNKWCWENYIFACIRIKLEPIFSPIIKNKIKYIRDLDIKHKTMKLLEKAVREIVQYIRTSKYLFVTTSEVQDTKAKIDKWDYIKPKCPAVKG
jgi:hypothetical protein